MIVWVAKRINTSVCKNNWLSSKLLTKQFPSSNLEVHSKQKVSFAILRWWWLHSYYCWRFVCFTGDVPIINNDRITVVREHMKHWCSLFGVAVILVGDQFPDVFITWFSTFSIFLMIAIYGAPIYFQGPTVWLKLESVLSALMMAFNCNQTTIFIQNRPNFLEVPIKLNIRAIHFCFPMILCSLISFYKKILRHAHW